MVNRLKIVHMLMAAYQARISVYLFSYRKDKHHTEWSKCILVDMPATAQSFMVASILIIILANFLQKSETRFTEWSKLMLADVLVIAQMLMVAFKLKLVF